MSLTYSAIMDHIWLCLIRILFQISFFMGVSYFREGKYLVFDRIVFCAAIIWFGGCTIRLETDGLVFGDHFQSFRMCVIFISLFLVNIILFATLIVFRFKNYYSFKLIALNRKLDRINLRNSSRLRRRYLVTAFGVIGFHLLCGVLFLYWEITASNVSIIIYDRFCASTLPWPTTVLCFQFSCWVQIFTLNFKLVSKKIRTVMICVMQTNSEQLADGTLSKLNKELKMVVQLKRAITDTYGSSMVFNQLYTFICAMLNITLLTHVEVDDLGMIQVNWYRYYYVARIIYYSILSYIPHYIGQMAFSEVSIPWPEVKFYF